LREVVTWAQARLSMTELLTGGGERRDGRNMRVL
jgi:hypothetical protein